MLFELSQHYLLSIWVISNAYFFHGPQMLENEQFTLEVDAHDLDSYDPELYEKMVRYAADAIVLFDNALARASVDLEVAFDPEQPFQVSLYNLREQKPMRDLNPSDIESLISIKGMVTRTSGIIPEMIEACFICQVRL
jgi:DNA replication licensing factor MCM4